jgi:UDP-glucose 4-epimerase
LQLRDPVHVDDIVEALLLGRQAQCAPARVYNIGVPAALSVAEMARILCAAGGAAARYRPFPETLKRINTGRYYSDCRPVKRELKWTPQMPFSRCVASTLAYFRHNLPHDLDSTRTCDCKLRELNDTRQRLTTA